MPVKELIEQIGGRERLEQLTRLPLREMGNGSKVCAGILNIIGTADIQTLARALLAVLDAQESGLVLRPFGYDGDTFIKTDIDHPAAVVYYTTPPAASAPEGWKLMPLKASPEILQAGIKAHYERQKHQQPEDVEFKGPMECAYDDMLSAAPDPGGE